MFSNLINIFYIISMLLGDSLCYYKQSYEVNVESLQFRTTVENQQTIDLSGLRLIGRNRVINGTINLLEDLTYEQFEVFGTIYMDSTNSGDFQPMPYNLTNMSPCEAVAKYGSYAKPALKEGVNTNFPIDSNICPIPKNFYYFKEIVLETDNWPSTMLRGVMKAVLYLTKDNITIGEAVMMARIRDKYL